SEKWSKYSQDVLPVFVAESDFPLATPIAEALHRAIDAGDLGYAQPKGVGDAYATFARGRFHHETEPASVFVIPEVMVGVAEILRTTTAPGDKVIINPPVYPPFFATIAEVGRSLAEVPLTAREDGFNLDFDALEREFAAGAAAYLFCNPHNPTGRVFSSGDVLRVATLAKKYGVVVLADEVHAPLVLPGGVHTPFESVVAETGVHAVTLTSASKGWNIAGLKCAVAISRRRGAALSSNNFPGRRRSEPGTSELSLQLRPLPRELRISTAS
nr:aminotransferase class I/II-fold pyridoxal phosphate-dependent enzyme [Candidatus Eremiobacteraeota bacterium]